MKLRRLTPISAILFLYGVSSPIAAVSVNSNSEISLTSQQDNKEKKEKKKKEKKKKEVKSPEEILKRIKDLEWKKPPIYGKNEVSQPNEVNKYYDDADKFFNLLKNVDQRVTLYKVCKIVSPSGESVIAPVEISTGAIRHTNEAIAQVMESIGYGTELGLQSTLLGTEAALNSVQIAADAVPFIGDPNRKAANGQITKALKAFPLLKELINSQLKMMNRYFKNNANVETTDSVTDAIATGDVDFMEVLNMSDEELEEYIAAEASAN